MYINTSLELIGYSILLFVIVVYITNIEDCNAGFKYLWNNAITNGRIAYQQEHYPIGYIPGKPKQVTYFKYQEGPKQKYYRDTLYNRKMMLR